MTMDLKVTMSLVWINFIISMIMIFLRKSSFGDKYEDHRASMCMSGIMALIIYLATLANTYENFGIDNTIKIAIILGSLMTILRVFILCEEQITKMCNIKGDKLYIVLELSVFGCSSVMAAITIASLLIYGYLTKHIPDIINYLSINGY